MSAVTAPEAGELREAWRAAVRRMLALLGLAFVLALAAGWVWLGDDWFDGRTSVTAAVIGTVLAAASLTAAVAAVVWIFRSPEPRLRPHFPPGRLGPARVNSVWLAFIAVLPFLYALTIVLER